MDDINEASNDSITGNISEENNISMGFNGTLRVGFGCFGGHHVYVTNYSWENNYLNYYNQIHDSDTDDSDVDYENNDSDSDKVGGEFS